MYARSRLIAKFVNGFDQLNSGSVIADILITSVRTEEFDSDEFNGRLRKFRKRVLQRIFPKGLCIITRSDSNRLHCHCAVQTDIPVAAFDWDSFEESERYYALYRQFKDRRDLDFYKYYTRKYMKSLPKEWRVKLLRVSAGARHYGLGRARMVPVRKNMNAYKWYLVGNIPKRREPRDKGLQYYTNWGVDRIKDFQVINKFTMAYRSKLKAFSIGLQLESDNYNIILRNALGTRWFCRCEDLIRDIHKLSPSQADRYRMLQHTIKMYQLRSSS